MHLVMHNICLSSNYCIYACCFSVLGVPDSLTTSCVKQDGIEMHAASVLLDMPAKTDMDLTIVPFLFFLVLLAG